MSTVSAMEKEPKASEVPDYVPEIQRIGSCFFEHSANDCGKDFKIKITVALDIGSSCVKAYGVIIVGGVTYRCEFPRQGHRPSQYLRVNLKTVPTTNILKESESASVRYLEVSSENFSFQFDELPTQASQASLGIRMPKATVCQSCLVDSSTWSNKLWNNEVRVTDKSTRISYRYINLGKILAAGKEGSDKEDYVVLAWNLIAAKKTALAVAEVIAELAGMIAPVIPVPLKTLFESGIELFIVNATPTGSPLPQFNDAVLQDEIEEELRHLYYRQEAGTSVVSVVVDEAQSTFRGKFAVRYTVFNETISGLTRVLETERGTQKRCAVLDFGHSTSQIDVFEISGSTATKDELITTLNSASTSFGGLYFAHRVLRNYCEKVKLDSDAILWGGNTLNNATANYTLIEELISSWERVFARKHDFLLRGKDDETLEARIDMEKFTDSIDSVGRESIAEMLAELEKGKFFDSRSTSTRVLSVTGRLSMLKFRNGKFALMTLANAIDQAVREKLPTNVLLKSTNVQGLGNVTRIQDIAESLCTLATERPGRNTYSDDCCPMIYSTLVFAERVYSTLGKIESWQLGGAKACRLSRGAEFIIDLAGRKDDFKYYRSQILVCAPIDIASRPVDAIFSELESMLNAKKLEPSAKLMMIPMFSISPPENACSNVRAKLTILGTFAAIVSFEYKNSDGDVVHSPSRLLRFSIPNVRVDQAVFSIEGRRVTLDQFRPLRSANINGVTPSKVIEDNMLCHILADGKVADGTYMQKCDRGHQSAVAINVVEDSIVIPSVDGRIAVRGSPIPLKETLPGKLIPRHSKKKDAAYKKPESDSDESDDDAVDMAKCVVEEEEKEKKKKSAKSAKIKKPKKKRKQPEEEEEDDKEAKKKAKAKAKEKEANKKRAKKEEVVEEAKPVAQNSTTGLGYGKKKHAEDRRRSTGNGKAQIEERLRLASQQLEARRLSQDAEEMANERDESARMGPAIVQAMEKAQKAPQPITLITFSGERNSSGNTTFTQSAQDVLISGDGQLVPPPGQPASTDHFDEETGYPVAPLPGGLTQQEDAAASAAAVFQAPDPAFEPSDVADNRSSELDALADTML